MSVLVDGSIQARIARRPRCPFYGFSLLDGLREAESNGCPFGQDHTPCVMEAQQQTPTWEKCTRYNTSDHRAELIGTLDERYISLIKRDEKLTLREWLELTDIIL